MPENHNTDSRKSGIAINGNERDDTVPKDGSTKTGSAETINDAAVGRNERDDAVPKDESTETDGTGITDDAAVGRNERDDAVPKDGSTETDGTGITDDAAVGRNERDDAVPKKKLLHKVKKFIRNEKIETGLMIAVFALLIGNFFWQFALNAFILPRDISYINTQIETINGELGRLREDVKNDIDSVQESIDTQVGELKETIEKNRKDLKSDINKLESDIDKSEDKMMGLLFYSISAKATPEFAKTLYDTYARDDVKSDARLEAIEVAAMGSSGVQLTVGQLTSMPILLPYSYDGQTGFFYGQISNDNCWDGNCVTNLYDENGNLSLITDAEYENGHLARYVQVFPDSTTGEDKSQVWVISDRTIVDGAAKGATWHFYRNGDIPMSFNPDEVLPENIISAQDFAKSATIGTIECYYSGSVSDGYLNDTTGSSYMLKFFKNGLVKTLYVGDIVDGQFEDSSNDSFLIGKKTEDQEKYFFYNGSFHNGECENKEDEFWNEIENPATENVQQYISGMEFGCERYGFQVLWELPDETI